MALVLAEIIQAAGWPSGALSVLPATRAAADLLVTDDRCKLLTFTDVYKRQVILGITHELSVPVRYIGVGEKIGDLRAFDAEDFVDVLYDRSA